MSRILWLGNPPGAPSGYGEQAALFVPRLQAMGHQLGVQANWGIGFKIDGDTPFYPTDNHWGNLSIGACAADFKADLVLALGDAWTLHPDAWPDTVPPVGLWAPLDHYPIPPAVLATLQHERIRPIAMCRFGEEWMRRFGLEPLYIPHGVDTSVFRPMPEVRRQIRQGLGIPPGDFLVGMVAANKSNAAIPRKAFPQALDAFARFSEGRDDCWLYLHTEMKPPPGTGMDLHTLAKAVGVREDRLAYPPPEAWVTGRMGRPFMASLYNGFDVLLNPAMGEGFGVPIVEAQACGVPAIVSDHSAMTELAGPAGWLVSGDRWWDALQASFLHMPSIAAVAERLGEAYEARGDTMLRDACVDFAQEYDADRVAELYWRPALEALLGPREVGPLPGLNRAQRRALAKAAK